MSVLIATDVAILSCEGKYYYASQVAVIMNRYYNQFGKIKICGRERVVQSNEITPTHVEVTDLIEGVVAIPSLAKVMSKPFAVKIKCAVMNSDFVICRCPGIIAFRVADAAHKLGKKCFAESMGCAWDAYWNHGILGKIVAPYMYLKMKQTVYNADYALYVTSRFLQERYPCKNESVAASNVLIDNIDESVLNQRLNRIARMDTYELTLATTAAVDVRYKGQEFVIRAIPKLNKAGIRVRYLLIGGGDRTFLEGVARKYGVEDQVEFTGRHPLTEVLEILDNTDIYIQPSLQEGLPRSVIEAMSRGCPCIGARTAGIPELIDDEYVVRRKSVNDIVTVVSNFALKSTEDLWEVAKRNFCEAKKYSAPVLDKRRNDYYAKVVAEIGEKDACG